MRKSIRIPAIRKAAVDLEAMMDAARPFRDAEDVRDVRLAFGSLLLALHNHLDALEAIGGRASLQEAADAACKARMDRLMVELAAKMPPVRGGGDPGDFEVVDEAVFGDEWPAYPHPELDGFVYEMGPTPTHVLAASAPTWEPSTSDWSDYLASDSAGISESDHAVAHGCC